MGKREFSDINSALANEDKNRKHICILWLRKRSKTNTLWAFTYKTWRVCVLPATSWSPPQVMLWIHPPHHLFLFFILMTMVRLFWTTTPSVLPMICPSSPSTSVILNHCNIILNYHALRITACFQHLHCLLHHLPGNVECHQLPHRPQADLNLPLVCFRCLRWCL